MAIVIGIGSVVKYALTQLNLDTINYRRGVRGRDTQTDIPETLEHGGAMSVGQLLPMTVTVVVSSTVLNGQVLLDGDDSLWVAGVPQGTGPGTWQ